MKMCAQDIEFTLIRSERKTADIVIERSGDVIVRAPLGVHDERVREVVADRALWVHRSLAEWEDLNSSRRHRPLVQGQGFAYLGRSYRLKFVTDADVPLRLKNGRWELSEAFVNREGEAAARKAFRDFYTAKACRYSRTGSANSPRWSAWNPARWPLRNWDTTGRHAAQLVG